MATSFLSLLNPVEVQQATLQAGVRQQRENLAVTQLPVLAPAVNNATRRLALGHRLNLADQRLDLRKDQAKFEERLLPFEIGTSVLNIGSDVVSGFDAFARDRRQRASATRREALDKAILAERQRFTQQFLQTVGTRSQQAQSFAQPTSSSALSNFPMNAP